jgi:protein-S-isoprenylcysteine O-methyltransferase Ste14
MFALKVLLPGATVLSFPSTLAGVAPVLAGFALNLAADQAFKRQRTTVKPFEVPTSLVTDGVFTLSRNPMYLGMVLFLFGLAMLLGALSPFAVVIGFAVLLHYWFVVVEEQMLAERFGEAWLNYRQKVRRWI